jgi:Emfourin
MKIWLRQKGGYVGTTIELISFDTDRMPAETARTVRVAVTAAGFFDLPATVAGDTVGGDVLSYEICIEDGARQHCVTFVDDDSPGTAQLRRLKDTLLAVGASGSR